MKVDTKLFALMCVQPDGTRTIFGKSESDGFMPVPVVVTIRSILERMVLKMKPLLREVEQKHNITFEIMEFELLNQTAVKP